MSLLGETGLRQLALLNHEKALATRDALAAVPGVEVLTPRFFNEFAVRLPRPAAEVVEACWPSAASLAGVPYSPPRPATPAWTTCCCSRPPRPPPTTTSQSLQAAL